MDIGIIVIILLGIALVSLTSHVKTVTKKPICKLHIWAIDIQGFYFCKECNRRPGEMGTSYDKPY